MIRATPRTVGRMALATSLALTGALGLTACGDDEEDGSSAASTTEAPAAAVEVSGAWARTSPASAEFGAAYMTLTASEEDALVGAAVDPSVAAEVQVHETVMAGGDTSSSTMGGDDMSGGSMEGSGAMTMQEVDHIDLPAGEGVALEPGGYHIMLMDLAAPLEVGQTIEVTLDFENTPDQTVEVPVRDEAP
jgi:hypothetical protein